MNSNKKEIPKNIIKWSSNDPEKILLDNLTNKFGKRFRDYRKDYYSYIDNYNSDYLFQPI